MSQKASNNKVRDILLSFRSKSAAEHNLTAADGRGDTTTVSNGSIKPDSGADDVKKNLPPTGALPDVANPTKPNDPPTVADARQDTASASIPGDPGQADIKANLPDGSAIKVASERVQRIAALLTGQPATTKQAAAPAPAAPAAKSQIDLDDATLLKVARAVVSTEEGIRYALGACEKQAGAKQARELIADAIRAAELHDATDFHKQAAFDTTMEKAANIHKLLQQNGVTEDDAELMLKQAKLHEDTLSGMDDLEKLAYAGGVEDAAAMEAAMLGEEGAAPSEDEAIAMGGDEISEEDVLALLAELIQTGEITPEELQEAINVAAGGEEAAAASTEAA